MFKEFIKTTANNDIRYPIKKYTKFEFIQRRYFDQLMTIKDYYRNSRIRSVDNRHILARIVDIMSPSTGLEITDFFKQVATNSRFVSKQFDIVSNINAGKVLENELWNDNTYEIFLYTENDIDIFTFEENWEDVTPLRVIKTSDTDLDFNFPYKFPKEYYTHKLFIYEIDIIKLCLQYRSWSNNQLKFSRGNDPTEFIATYVLPNMIDQILDYAVYNRFINLALKKNIQDFKIYHPFSVLDYSKGLDKILTSISKDVSNESIPLDQLLDSIPTFSGAKMKDIISLESRYFTTQSMWVLWLARIEDIVNLYKILGKKGYRRNKDLFHRIPIILKLIERRASNIEDRLPILLKMRFDSAVKFLNKELGKR